MAGSIRSLGLLLVLDRRGSIKEADLKFIQTPDFKKFYSKNLNKIKESACRIYGTELQEAVKNNDTRDMEDVIDDIDNHCSYKVYEIAVAVDLMASSGQNFTDHLDRLVDFIDFTTLYNAVIGGNKIMYDEIKKYDDKDIDGTYFHDESHKEIFLPSPSSPFEKFDVGKFFEKTILAAIYEYINHPHETRAYIFDDIVKHIYDKDFYTQRDFNGMVQDIGDSLKEGRLNDDYTQTDFKPVSRDRQKKAYRALIATFNKYPRVGFIDQFFN